MFVCNGIIEAFRKLHNTVKSSIFIYELVELHIYRDLIFELRIKLKSIGDHLKGPTDVYCNNQVVVKNSCVSKSTFNDNQNYINYHAVRKAAAARILCVGNEDTDTNLDDPLTELMPY